MTSARPGQGENPAPAKRCPSSSAIRSRPPKETAIDLDTDASLYEGGLPVQPYMLVVTAWLHPSTQIAS